ncbi:MAG: hypothetical protein RLY86_2406 [Pseudomonadota bacterium]|jgi:hypothetical protein
MLGSITASQAVRSLTSVTQSNIRSDLTEITDTAARMRLSPTTEQRTDLTIARLERNFQDGQQVTERTRGVGRGVVLDIEA